ncbi:MAG: response regulator [Chlorobiales bacterium]|nr:response regulator [Chlorobiales bacterium]
MEYEDLGLRLTASALSLFSLILIRLDSPLAKKLFPYYWHFSLIFVLPFLFTFLLLKNDFHELWLYWEIFMIFVLIAFVPNWLIFLFDLFAGVLCGIAVFMLTTPDTRLSPDFDIPMYLTVVLFTVVAGYLFSYSNRKGQVALEKNSALQALAGSIAHEMRNPLGQVKLNLEIIEQQLPDYKRGSASSAHKTLDNLFQVLDSLYQHVAWCQVAVKRGTQIINMILDEVREKPIHKSGFIYASAALITRKAIDEYGFESCAERGKIIYDGSRDFMFRISETMYLFVLFNLIKNALYFLESRPDARIYITLETGKRFNSVKVKDTGPGISPENLDKLFDPYFTASKKGGTGLGLSYCKRVMHAFDGDITCHSVEGEYAEFVLTFPVVTEDELRTSHDEMIRENRALFEKKRILVVDDKAPDRDAVRGALLPLGVMVDEAADGQEAVDKLSEADYDLVVMNLAMPVLDGYEATEMIRNGKAGEQAAAVPIIAYTEQPYTVAHGKTNKAGMQGLVAKPCSENELVRELAGVFRNLQGISLKKMNGKSLLIADDSSVNRIGLRMLLEKYGMHVEEAADGSDVLEMLGKGAFDLVLMDIGMPEVDGLEATKRIRRSDNSKTASVPVIGLSGESDEQLIKDALQAGMNDYLVKPVDSQLLLVKISQYL